MRSVERPEFDPLGTYNLCINGIRNDELRGRLELVADQVAQAAEDYAIHAECRQLHLMEEWENIFAVVTREEMIGVYSNRMVRKGSPARRIYDAIKLLPEDGICPFCDHNPVSTLDHVLPKATFPVLVVAPDNLVGACKDCNHAKAAHAPTCVEDCPLHPYFEDLSAERWLQGRVVEGEIAAVLFYVSHVDGWSPSTNFRIGRQFNLLNLSWLYANQAARFISGLRRNLVRIFEAFGEDGVREELRHLCSGWEERNQNCWQAVTLRALGESEWYCREGFRGM